MACSVGGYAPNAGRFQFSRWSIEPAEAVAHGRSADLRARRAFCRDVGGVRYGELRRTHGAVRAETAGRFLAIARPADGADLAGARSCRSVGRGLAGAAGSQ